MLWGTIIWDILYHIECMRFYNSLHIKQLGLTAFFIPGKEMTKLITAWYNEGKDKFEILQEVSSMKKTIKIKPILIFTGPMSRFSTS